jgi:hypothetical protein
MPTTTSIAVYNSSGVPASGIHLLFRTATPPLPHSPSVAVTLATIDPPGAVAASGHRDVVIVWQDEPIPPDEWVSCDIVTPFSAVELDRGYWLNSARKPISPVGPNDILLATAIPSAGPSAGVPAAESRGSDSGLSVINSLKIVRPYEKSVVIGDLVQSGLDGPAARAREAIAKTVFDAFGRNPIPTLAVRATLYELGMPAPDVSPIRRFLNESGAGPAYRLGDSAVSGSLILYDGIGLDPRFPRPLPDPVPPFPDDPFWTKEATSRFDEWTKEKSAKSCKCTHKDTFDGPKLRSIPHWKEVLAGQGPHWKTSNTNPQQGEVGGEKKGGGFTGVVVPPLSGMTRHWFWREGTLIVEDYKTWTITMVIVCPVDPLCPPGETVTYEYGEKVGEREIKAVERFYIDLPSNTPTGGTFSVKIEEENDKDGHPIGLKATQTGNGEDNVTHLKDSAPVNPGSISPDISAKPGTYGPGLP